MTDPISFVCPAKPIWQRQFWTQSDKRSLVFHLISTESQYDILYIMFTRIDRSKAGANYFMKHEDLT